MATSTPQFDSFETTCLWIDTQVNTYLKAQGFMFDVLPTDNNSRNVRCWWFVKGCVSEKKHLHAMSDRDEGNDKILRLGLSVSSFDIDALSKKMMKQQWVDCQYMVPVGFKAVDEIDRFELAAYSALHLAHRYGLTLIAEQYSELYEN